MTLPTNEQIALWLDPQRKHAGWWEQCNGCDGAGEYNGNFLYAKVDHTVTCGECDGEGWYFTGPDFYAAGVCAEEVEPVVLAKCYTITRTAEATEVATPFSSHFTEITRHHHHPTACALALAKIKESASSCHRLDDGK